MSRGALLASAIFIPLAFAGLITGIVGIVLWSGEKQAEEDYRGPVDCLVVSHTIVDRTCSEEDCTGSTDDKTCTTSYYTCYAVSWGVRYRAFDAPDGDNQTHDAFVDDKRTYDYYSSAQPRALDYSDGSTHDCFYDLTRYSSVRWSQPDAEAYFIMWVVSFSVAGCLCLTLGGVALWCASYRHGYTRI